uniref:Universal stress protein n=1 Tax=Roseihalotalea indica TaxID=2867963 RepID=A0AA49GLN4_9BACT|nr:universal stress protein [Tunicatimonas sp. TK19036]
MKTILVPTDFSLQAEYALDTAHQLAQRLGASIHLVYVMEYSLPVAKVEMVPIEYYDKAKEEISQRLRQLIENKGLAELPATYEVRIGNPYRSITQALLEKEVDLVVMGSKGASGIDEILIGSNAERMVRFASCPVLIIKDKTELAEIKKIVYATALRDEEGGVLKALSQLQQAYHAHLHLVKINTVSNFMADPTVRLQLQELAKKHGLENYTVHTFSDIRELEGIIHFADEVGADLIAMATHARQGIMHLLGGSIAEDVVNHAKHPVWTMSLHPHTD